MSRRRDQLSGRRGGAGWELSATRRHRVAEEGIDVLGQRIGMGEGDHVCPDGHCFRLPVRRGGGQFAGLSVGRDVIVQAPHDEYRRLDGPQDAINSIFARSVHPACHGADSGSVVVA
jgi:hypothetical protein